MARVVLLFCEPHKRECNLLCARAFAIARLQGLYSLLCLCAFSVRAFCDLERSQDQFKTQTRKNSIDCHPGVYVLLYCAHAAMYIRLFFSEFKLSKRTGHVSPISLSVSIRRLPARTPQESRAQRHHTKHTLTLECTT